MISGVRGASKSMKNLEKSNPECLGTPANRPGRAGLAGLAGVVAAELAHGGPNSISIANEYLWGNVQAEPGPRKGLFLVLLVVI